MIYDNNYHNSFSIRLVYVSIFFIVCFSLINVVSQFSKRFECETEKEKRNLILVIFGSGENSSQNIAQS